MYNYTIILDAIKYEIYHQKKFNSLEIIKIYNDIVETSNEYTEIENIIKQFCNKYGFFEMENPVTLELVKTGVSGYVNMYTVDVNNIDESDTYIDVYNDKLIEY